MLISNLKVLFLNPPFLPKFSRSQRSPAVIKSGTIYYPLWLAYAAGFLLKQGFDVNLIAAPAEGYDLSQTLDLVKSFNPRMVVIDTSTPSIDYDATVAEEIKKSLPDVFLVMVGTHVSATADETLKNYPWIDAIARKEYDETLLNVAHMLSKNFRPDADSL